MDSQSLNTTANIEIGLSLHITIVQRNNSSEGVQCDRTKLNVLRIMATAVPSSPFDLATPMRRRAANISLGVI